MSINVEYDLYYKRLEAIVRAVADKEPFFINEQKDGGDMVHYCPLCEVIHYKEKYKPEKTFAIEYVKHHPDCPAALAVELVKEMDREE